MHLSRASESRRAYAAAHYKANKADYLARNKERREKIRAYMKSLKEKPCTDCKETYPYHVMDFDHRAGELKLYEPSKLPLLVGMQIAIQELAKCDVVCSNCHRVRTHDREGAKKEPKKLVHSLSH